MKHFKDSLKEKFKNLDLGGLGTLTFFIFVFTIPFQKRIEFFNPHTFDYGTFIDYTTPLLYIVDFIFLASLLFLVSNAFLKHRNPFRSFKSPFVLTLLITLLGLTPSLFASHSIVSWSFFAQIALLLTLSATTFALTRTAQFTLLYLYPLVASGVYQSLIAIAQFTFQQSMGLGFLGESPFNINSLNVAKIVVNGARLIRVYGTFPHPNGLAAFLGITLAATILFFYISRESLLKNIWKVSAWLFFIIVQFSALLLTFSRSGWLGASIPLVFTAIYVIYKNERDQSGSNIKNSLRACLILTSVVLAGIVIVAYPLLISRATLDDSNGDFASTERGLLTSVSRETFIQHEFIGTGLHTFLSDVQVYSYNHGLFLPSWQFQPVHNIYFLVAAEAGTVGFIGFVVPIVYVFYLFVTRMRSIEPKKRLAVYFGTACLLSFLVEGLFDHHPWDIHQSQLLFWLLLGFTAGSLDVSRETSREAQETK